MEICKNDIYPVDKIMRIKPLPKVNLSRSLENILEEKKAVQIIW